MDERDETELKREYAVALLREPQAFKAACIVFPSKEDTGRALQIANSWFNDPFVLDEKKRLLRDPEAAVTVLPTKEVQAQALYSLAESTLVDYETRLKAHKQYSELMGFIEKPVPATQVNVLHQSVMIVRDHGSPEEWEKTAVAQQRTLTGVPVHVN